MRIGQEYIMMIMISYPLWSAALIIVFGVLLTELTERQDRALLLPAAASLLMAIRFFLLSVSLGEEPALLDRYRAQEIAATLDFAALILVAPYLAIVIGRSLNYYRQQRKEQSAP
jgi:hypothetical protein